jgi:hypothetical protein
MESRLEESIEKLQKEKEGLITKLGELEEQSKKDKSLANHNDNLKDQVTDLEDRLGTLKTSRDECIFGSTHSARLSHITAFT